MRYYKALDKQIHLIGDYKITPIRNQDRYDILKWRNEQIYHLRQESLLSKENQDIYFKNTIASLFKVDFPNQLLFSFFLKDKFIGYGGLVHIDWENKLAEISFLMNTGDENFYFESYWNNFLSLIETVAFSQLNFNEIFVFAFDVRKHLYPVLESNKYILTETKYDFYIFDNNKYDALVYSKKKLP